MAASLPVMCSSMVTNRLGRKSTVADGDWKQYSRPTSRAATRAARWVLRWSWWTSCTECV
jgi:hypothetical protein